MMNKSETAKDICEELEIDYFENYNQSSGSVTHKFLKAVHEEVVPE